MTDDTTPDAGTTAAAPEETAAAAPEQSPRTDEAARPTETTTAGDPPTAAGESRKAPPGTRRVSTRNLFAGALAFGILGGAATGYTLQALRDPTPLPPLAVTQPVYPPTPLYVGVRPAPLPTGQDDATIVNSDLRKLLPAKPAGATDWNYPPFADGWSTLMQYSQAFDDSAGQFATLTAGHFRRAVGVAWNQGNLQVQVTLVQFAPGGNAAQEYDASYRTTVSPGISTQTFGRQSDGSYESAAFGLHGDIAIEVWLWQPGSSPDPAIGVNLIKEELTKL